MTMDSTPSQAGCSLPVVERRLDLPALLRKKSHFLFGPRQTGKTFLIRHSLKGVRVYDLLDSSTYLALSQSPGRIAQELTGKDRIVVIDQIQRLPILLNEVHRLIKGRGIRFLLTASSARKLRRGGVNLLGGERESSAFTRSLTWNWAPASIWQALWRGGFCPRSTSRTILAPTWRLTQELTFSKKSWPRGPPATFRPLAGSSGSRRWRTARSSTSPT